MKQVLRSLGAVIVALLLSSIPAGAQLTGSLHTARPLDQKTTDVGGYFGLLDDKGKAGTAIAVFGQVRYGLFASGDGGLKFGLVDLDTGKDDVGIVLAADLQWALLAPHWGNQFWLSVGPEITLYDAAGVRVWGFAGNVHASHDTNLRGKRVSPYGRLTIRLESVDHDNPKRKGTTKLEIGLNPGVVWQASDLLDFVVELQFDNYFGLFAGLNFRI